MSHPVARVLCVAFLAHLCFAAPNGSPSDHADSAENAIDPPTVKAVPYFDLLIFTQRWAITACYEWKETNPSHICGLPSPAASWTIHGIWPTKLNTIGPAFCNKSAIFDVSQLSPIETQLEQHWVNVEKNKPFDSLWEHEWLKHGTCAAEVIEELNTERKYFGQGLNWLEQHSVGAAFAASGDIRPGGSYTIAALNKVLYDYYGKDAAIECYYDRKTHKQFLNEIRICFDKQLQPADCDGIVGLERTELPDSDVRSVITNCNAANPVFYPEAVPVEEEPKPTEEHRVSVYETEYEVVNGETDGRRQGYEFVEVILV